MSITTTVLLVGVLVVILIVLFGMRKKTKK